jgi:hypothetical protein
MDCRGQKKPSTPSDFPFVKHEHAKSLVFSIMLSPILDDPGKTFHPAQEAALRVVKSEAKPLQPPLQLHQAN